MYSIQNILERMMHVYFSAFVYIYFHRIKIVRNRETYLFSIFFITPGVLQPPQGLSQSLMRPASMFPCFSYFYFVSLLLLFLLCFPASLIFTLIPCFYRHSLYGTLLQFRGSKWHSNICASLRYWLQF